MKSVLELYVDQKVQEGLQREVQRGELKKSITIISNGLEEGIMPSTLSSISNVSHDFVRYIESYFRANSGKTDEENVNSLVDKVMNGEISTK